MFTGLHQENWVIRLPEKEREKFVTRHKAKIFEPMPGRVMKEYVVVPEKVKASNAELEKWLMISFDYARSLPKKR